jgi:hypothetical protein
MEADPTICQALRSDTIFHLCFTAIICLPPYAPLSGIEGLIIKEENNSDIMFQFLTNYGEDSTICPSAYPIFFRPDDITDMFSNSSCKFVPFSELCPVFGPLPKTNLSGAFRCHPNAGYGLELFASYLAPRLEFAHTATNLVAAFIFLFEFGYFSLSRRRWSSPDEWCENHCC